MPDRLDNKYTVVKELHKDEWMRSVIATDPSGKTVRVDWFFVVDPKSRANYHRYRTAIKNIASPLLLDAISRPGAYYTVWEILEGIDSQTWLSQHPKDLGFRTALSEAAEVLASYGFALQDAQFIALQGAKGEVKPALAGLQSQDRSSEEILQLNKPILEPSPSHSKVASQKQASKSKVPVLVQPQMVTQSENVARMPNPNVSKTQVTPLRAAAPKPSFGLRFLAFLVRVIPGAVALAGVIYFGAQATRQFLEPPTVVVPNVIGKTSQEAAKLLSDARLTPRLVEDSDQSKRRGIILAQNPQAGTSITEQRVVEITVNQPRALLMPNLSGKTLAEAQITLKESKLSVGRIARVPAPEGMARDFILGQNPAPEAEVVRGQSITLLVSGPRAEDGKTFIPDLKGLNTEDAQMIIKLANLRLVEIKTQISNLPYGTVLAQSPQPDSLVALESDAVITVAVTANAAKPVIPQPVRPKPQPLPAANPNPQQTQPNQPNQPQTSPQNPSARQNPSAPNQPNPSTNPDAPNNTPDAPNNTPDAPNNTPDAPNNTDPNNLPPVTAPTIDPDTPATPPDNPQPTTPTLIEPRSETLRYEVPADLGSATLEVRVTDLDGTRTVETYTVVGGQVVNITLTVRAEAGQAQITILIDGELKKTENI
ncbi:MAG: PASTA domain-containing protein [Deinococcales bacterium]